MIGLGAATADLIESFAEERKRKREAIFKKITCIPDSEYLVINGKQVKQWEDLVDDSVVAEIKEEPSKEEIERTQNKEHAVSCAAVILAPIILGGSLVLVMTGMVGKWWLMVSIMALMITIVGVAMKDAPKYWRLSRIQRRAENKILATYYCKHCKDVKTSKQCNHDDRTLEQIRKSIVKDVKHADPVFNNNISTVSMASDKPVFLES